MNATSNEVNPRTLQTLNARKDKATASLLGLAVGDALGVTIEFMMRDTFQLHTEILGDPRRNIERGHWTDDTSMALALADSLLNTETFDPHDLMTRFISWWQDGAYSPANRCVDIGNQTHDVLENYKRNKVMAYDDWLRPLSGNGSIMRIAPVAIRWHSDIDMAIRIADEQGRTTHPSHECIESCQVLTSILVDLINGLSIDIALENASSRVKITIPAVEDIAGGTWKYKTRDQIQSGGYVIDTLEAALWTIYNSDDFCDALILAVNLGNDADTVGAVTGQIAGALYGLQSIPCDWLGQTFWTNQITKYAHDLFDKNLIAPRY